MSFDDWPDVLMVGNSCTGVAIDSIHFLSAWHCTPIHSVVSAGTSFEVEGCLSPPSSLGKAAQDMALCTIVPHQPNGHFKRYVSLASSDTDLTGTPVVLLGVGSSGYDVQDYGELRAVDVLIAGDKEGELSIGTANQGSCPGDSGGPAFYVPTEGSRELVGILTSGQPGSCGLGYYSKVSTLASWIDEETTLDSGESSCQFAPAPLRPLRPKSLVILVFLVYAAGARRWKWLQCKPLAG